MKKLLKVYYDYYDYSKLIDYKVIEDSPEMREYIKWDHHFPSSFNEKELQPFVDGEVDQITWETNHETFGEPVQIQISLLTYEEAIEEIDEIYRKIFYDFDKENYIKEITKIKELFNK